MSVILRANDRRNWLLRLLDIPTDAQKGVTNIAASQDVRPYNRTFLQKLFNIEPNKFKKRARDVGGTHTNISTPAACSAGSFSAPTIAMSPLSVIIQQAQEDFNDAIELKGLDATFMSPSGANITYASAQAILENFRSTYNEWQLHGGDYGGPAPLEVFLPVCPVPQSALNAVLNYAPELVADCDS